MIGTGGRAVRRCARGDGGGIGGVVVARGRHEGDDKVQRGGAHEGEAVDVAEMEFSRKSEEEAEADEEDEGADDVAVVHDVLVDAAKRVEDGYCLENGEFIWSVNCFLA